MLAGKTVRHPFGEEEVGTAAERPWIATADRIDRPRRQRAQLKEPDGVDPARRNVRLLRAERIGQEHAGARHDLRRGATSLRRIAFELCPPVSRAGSEAEGRIGQRPVAGHQHRTENDDEEPAFDGWDHHRNLRLPSRSVRSARPGILPGLSNPNRHANRPTRSSNGFCRCRKGRSSISWPRSNGKGRRNTRRCSTKSAEQALCECASTANRTASTIRRTIDHRRKHRVEVIVDRNVVRTNHADAYRRGGGTSTRLWARELCTSPMSNTEIDETKWKVERFSQHLACDNCGRSYEALNPHNFSFNSPLGWCPSCEGLGVQHGANTGPAPPRSEPLDSRWSDRRLASPGRIESIPRFRRGDCPARRDFARCRRLRSCQPQHQRAILHGTAETGFRIKGNWRSIRFQYKGLYPAIDEASRVSFVYRQRLEHLVDEVPCSDLWRLTAPRSMPPPSACRPNARPACRPASRGTLQFFKDLKLTKQQRQVAGELLREITQPPAIPGRRRSGLSDPIAAGPDAVRRGSAADSPGESDRQRLDGCSLCAG